MMPRKAVNNRLAFSGYLLLLAMTTLLAAALPAGSPVHIFHIPVSNHMLGLTILLSRDAIVWLFAYIGYTRLAGYAFTLVPAVEATAMRRMAGGIGLLALSMAIPGIIWRVIAIFIQSDVDARTLRALSSGYVGLALTIVGFILLRNGLQQLVKHTDVAMRPRGPWQLLVTIFAIIGIGFAYFIIRNFEQYHPPIHISSLGVLLTFVLPYLFAWFVGLTCINDLWLYVRNVSGKIYKSAFRWLGIGLVALVAMQISVQSVEGSMAYNASSPNNLVIAAIFMLSALQAIAFVFIAQGATHLNKIEEV